MQIKPAADVDLRLAHCLKQPDQVLPPHPLQAFSATMHVAPTSIPDLLRTTWWALLTVASVLVTAGVDNVHAEEIKIGGTGTALATMQLAAQAYGKNHPEARITVVPSLGSGGGIKAVLAGAIQLAVSARPLNEAEAKLGAVAIPYGSTPFVFATSTSNPVAGLTLQELVDIYAGRTEQWAGGQKIRLVLRPVGDTDSEMIKGISPAMRDAKSSAEQRKGMPFAVSDQDAADSIEKIPGALGPSTLAQILSEKRLLKALRLNGVEPSAKTIADGSYPLRKELLLVTGPNTPPSAQQFVAFVRSAPGQEILRQTGHWVK
jgi:phosphate transport system substrate-binding protein